MATLGHKLDGNTLALWRLDDASGAASLKDETGTYPLVTLGGPPPVVAGKIGNARAVTTSQAASSASVPTNDPAIAALQSGNFTAESWFWVDPSISYPATWNSGGTGNNHGGLGALANAGNGSSFIFGLDNIGFFVYNVSHGFQTAGSWSTLTKGAWHHLAVRSTFLDATHSTVDYFLDGVKTATATILTYALTPSPQPWWTIGGESMGFNNFTGRIDDSRFSKVARTDAEISDSFWRGLIDRQSPQFAVPPMQITGNQDFQNYQQVLSPTALTDPTGTLFESAFGAMKDVFADRLRLSLKSRLPQNAPPDALTQIGLERGMPQGFSESGTAYAARLQDAWNAWPWAGTAFGLLRTFYATGYTNVVLAQVRGGKQFTLDNGGTNLLIWSNGFPLVGIWYPGNLTVTKNAAAAPDGTATATKISEPDVVNEEHYLEQTIAIAANLSGTYAVYAKAAERTWLFLSEVLRDAASVPGIYYDLTNGVIGTISSSGGVTPTGKITSVGNGWYRCEFTGSVGTGGTNPRVRIQLASANGTKIYAGTVNSGLYIAYASIEQSVGPAGPYVQTYSVNAPSTLGAGNLVTSTMGSGIWETDPLSAYSPPNQSFWSKFDVVFPLPLMPPSWGWAGGIPASNSAESNFIRALIQAWKPAHATVNRIVIQTQGMLLGYPATRTLGASNGVLGGSNVVWTP